MTAWFKLHAPAILDLAERTFATFAQAFLAILIVNEGSLSQVTALETAGAAGALAVAKFLLVKINTYLGPPAAAAKAAAKATLAK